MSSHLSIISCPYGEAGRYLGAEDGPEALLKSGLAKSLSALGYDISSHLIFPQRTEKSAWTSGIHNLPALLSIIASLKKATFEALQNGSFPCIIGGDHSLSMGSISGIAKYCHQHHKKLFVLWLDAHADCNTPQTSLTGNIHGMPVAHLCGWGDPLLLKIIEKENFLNPAQIYYFGLRSIDPQEDVTLKNNPFHLFSMKMIKEKGFLPLLLQTLETLKKHTNVHVHVSFDIDVLDASLVPGTGTPEKDGLTLPELRQAFIELSASKLVHSLDVMELNPALDSSGQTTKNTAALIPFLFGKIT